MAREPRRRMGWKAGILFVIVACIIGLLVGRLADSIAAKTAPASNHGSSVHLRAA